MHVLDQCSELGLEIIMYLVRGLVNALLLEASAGMVALFCWTVAKMF
jgi:hypothetical protein